MDAETAQKTVLVVDNEEEIRALLSEMLGREPLFRVLVAADGLEALETARRERPDVILLDIVMPRMSGWEVCAALKADPATRVAKVFMVSALGEQSHKERAAALGADGYLTKPFNVRRLTSLILETLGL